MQIFSVLITHNGQEMRTLLLFLTVAFFATTQTLYAIPFPQHSSFDVGFSPRGGATKLIIEAIEEARQEILIASYSFTSYEVCEALIKARRREISIKVIADHSNKNNLILKHLQPYGIKVRLNYKYKMLHDKFMVIDSLHVQTGSFNYTKSASKHNAENVIIIWNVADLAKIYEAEWQKLWQEGRELTNK